MQCKSKGKKRMRHDLKEEQKCQPDCDHPNMSIITLKNSVTNPDVHAMMCFVEQVVGNSRNLAYRTHKKVMALEKTLARHEELERETMEYSKVMERCFVNYFNLILNSLKSQTAAAHRKIQQQVEFTVKGLNIPWSMPNQMMQALRPAENMAQFRKFLIAGCHSDKFKFLRSLYTQVLTPNLLQKMYYCESQAPKCENGKFFKMGTEWFVIPENFKTYVSDFMETNLGVDDGNTKHMGFFSEVRKLTTFNLMVRTKLL